MRRFAEHCQLPRCRSHCPSRALREFRRSVSRAAQAEHNRRSQQDMPQETQEPASDES